MNTKKLALSAAFLILVIAFLACRAPVTGGGGTPSFIISETTAPAEGGAALSTPAPGVPTNTDGAETIVIPGGTFWMGSDEAEALADEDEKPRHQVSVGTFPIYTHEVTNTMYARCVEAGGCIPIPVLEGAPASHLDDPGYAEHPVVGVDWNMADDYCAWANSRLPTEAEWEYAARGADSLTYPWGEETPACDRLNMSGCQTPPGTVPVGSYLLGNSPFEVWDMAGNVWEWTHDWYDPDYYALSVSTSPLGPNVSDDLNHPQKVARGGGMNSEPAGLRSANRIAGNPLRSYDDVGFRCVAQPPLDLPANYAEVPEGHEWVPPDSLDDGDSIEHEDGDSPWVVVIGGGNFSCPDAEGRVRYTQPAVSSVDPTAFTASVGGVALDCSFDPATDRLDCSGFPPPDYDTWGPVVEVEVCFSHAYGAGCMTNHASKPGDCPAEGTEPFEVSATAGCPDAGGSVTIVFEYTPPMRLDTILLEGADVPWWPLGENQTNAIVPGRAPGDHYSFYLHGTDAAGREYEAWPTAVIPMTCAPMWSTSVEPMCWEHAGLAEPLPMVRVSYAPRTRTLLFVGVGADHLGLCVGEAPGVQLCGPLPGDPGSTITVSTRFTGEAPERWPITVPACAGEAETGVEVTTLCDPHTDLPAVQVSRTPITHDLPRVYASGGTFSLCHAPALGSLICLPLPGAAGSTTTVRTCYPGEPCQNWPVTVPTCPGGSEESGVEVIPVCSLGVPAVQVSRTPVTHDVPRVHAAGGTFSLCHAPALGSLICLPLPGEVGSDTRVGTCYPGEPCQTWSVTVLDCGEEEEPSEGEFRLAGIGCHDETHIFFIVDTGLAWLVPGAGYTYSARDGDSSYSCSVHPTIAGRLYCSGGRPVSPGTLNVCIDQDGPEPMICEGFADWPAQESSIPDCASEEPPPAVDRCSVYTNITDCGKAYPKCEWDGYCHTP